MCFTTLKKWIRAYSNGSADTQISDLTMPSVHFLKIYSSTCFSSLNNKSAKSHDASSGKQQGWRVRLLSNWLIRIEKSSAVSTRICQKRGNLHVPPDKIGHDPSFFSNFRSWRFSFWAKSPKTYLLLNSGSVHCTSFCYILNLKISAPKKFDFLTYIRATR